MAGAGVVLLTLLLALDTFERGSLLTARIAIRAIGIDIVAHRHEHGKGGRVVKQN